jgi:protein phosphatase
LKFSFFGRHKPLNDNDETRVLFGGASDVGAVRRQNEDAWSALPGSDLWLVADGMGGAAAGDVASQLAIEEVNRLVVAGTPLSDAVASAHDTIVSAPAAGRGSAGMGTTLVALRLEGGRYELAWVGDSRIYRLRAGELAQLTRDHSLVQDLVESGEITAAEARVHPKRNIITRALGALSSPAPKVGRREGSVHAGDVFLLCTDGLNGELADDRIRFILVDSRDPQDAARRLVAAAVAAGGQDNVTAVVIAVRE